MGGKCKGERNCADGWYLNDANIVLKNNEICEEKYCPYFDNPYKCTSSCSEGNKYTIDDFYYLDTLYKMKEWLNHNVSNTINVRPDEWDEVEKFIYNNRKYFCGISLLPVSGDKDYPQAPFTTIYLPSEQVAHYGDASLFVSGLIEIALDLWEDNLWAACDSLNGMGKQARGDAKRNWIAKCKKFARKYMGGDVKKLTYCMKDVYNWKEWVDLNREYKEVDYTNVTEEQDNVEPIQEIACSGGVCEII